MKDWFKKWFASDEYLSVYSHRNQLDAEDIINLILRNISVDYGSSVLDAACGAGRHSIFLANKGFKVTAFDLSKNLLRIGKTNAQNLNADVDFLCGDIRDIFFTRSFHLVLNMFTSFGYFDTDKENFSFFKNAKKFIVEDGYLVLDYINANFLKNNLVEESEKIINGRTIIEKRRIQEDKVIKNIEIRNNGETKSFIESVKLYDYEILENNFVKLGYKVHEVFGNYKGDIFDNNSSDRLIIIFKS